jgi:hypothetical protein
MIPSLTASGALPPFIGQDPTRRADCSPYEAPISALRTAFAHTPAREALLVGLLDYREALRAAGIADGFQYIDGSFTEDCERLRGRPPGDIDVVTFAALPCAPTDRMAFLQAHAGLFNPLQTKLTYHCDAYFVDLQKPPRLLVADSAYWSGLFSHQRVTALWKGMVQISLASDDGAVRQALAGGMAGGTQP